MNENVLVPPHAVEWRCASHLALSLGEVVWSPWQETTSDRIVYHVGAIEIDGRWLDSAYAVELRHEPLAVAQARRRERGEE